MSVITPKSINITISPQPSKFTYDDLNKLRDRSKSYLLKLAVIGHIDLNAFFAQVEQIRLNLSIDDPVVCVQWQAVIAVSYAARKFGIKRMDTIKTVKEKCPHVILAHAAVYEKGSSNWKYLSRLPYQGRCKVSLDPYRRESRKIFKILSQECDLVQKASVDEGYLDFGRMVYDKLMEYIPSGTDGPLPDVFQIPLQYHGELFNKTEGIAGETVGEHAGEYKTNLEETLNEIVINDWDDVIMILGSNMLYDLRAKIYNQLGYTTSGGISRNKNIAKLAGGYLKPDNQTIILNDKIPHFLKQFELIDINGMGGKLGESILSHFKVPNDVNSIEYLMSLDAATLKSSEFDNLCDIIWGDYKQELKDRTDIKSMMSRKQMTGNTPITSLFDSLDWLKTFSGDLINRLEDLDEESNQLIRPKTLSVNISILGGSHSKQCSIPVIPDLTKLKPMIETLSLKLLVELINGLFDLTKLNKDYQSAREINIVNQVNIPPISNMAVIISSLQRLDNSIDNFTKGHQVDLFEKFQREQEKEQEKLNVQVDKHQGNKKLDKQFITSLFAKYEQSRPSSPPASASKSSLKPSLTTKKIKKPLRKSPKYDILQTLTKCKQCGERISNNQEHEDFHRALALSKVECENNHSQSSSPGNS